MSEGLMAIQRRENQYKGVNAHLQSIFQSKGGASWSSFHSKHVSDLSQAIDDNLPTGYNVVPEQSLQIREYHPDSGERIRTPQPDISVFSRSVGDVGQGQSGVVSPTLSAPVLETLSSEAASYLTGIVVYEADADNPFGRAVLRLELLSRANKRGGSGDILYAEKRASTLGSGVRLVEVDYLHESHPVINRIPVYPKQANAYPYHIIMSDPLTVEDAQARMYGFSVDVPIPVLALPLLREDTVTVDFNVVYQTTYTSLSAYSILVDYAQEPARMESYSEADQARIRAVMARVGNG
jgi:hypothetical protein